MSTQPWKVNVIKTRRWLAWAALMAGAAALVGSVLTVAPAYAEVSDPYNPTVQYANQAWNWLSPVGASGGLAHADSYDQANFECAEFVSRALAAAGLIPRLTAYSPRTGVGSFEEYQADNGKIYNLLNVGSEATIGGGPVVIPIGYNPGLYDYLIDTGIGTDIGYNTGAAMPGDVVFWYGENGSVDRSHRHHAAVLVHTGTPAQTLYDGHYIARLNKQLSTSDDEVKSIVRINRLNLMATTTTLANNTSACPGSQQFFTGNDVNGVPINWTYANGSNACIRVSYTPRTTTSTCTFRFFVPAGNATSTVIFGYWTTDGVKHYASIDENPREGWYTIFTSANVTAINFQDNNGAAYPQELGWGSDRAHGLIQAC